MVALSVSISASTSPFFTASPTFLFHVAITPSVMVSLNLGIKTTSSIFDISIALVAGLAASALDASAGGAAAG